MNREQGIAKEKVDPSKVVLQTPSLHKAWRKLQWSYFLKSATNHSRLALRWEIQLFGMGKRCRETCSGNLTALCAWDKELVWSYTEEKERGWGGRCCKMGFGT